MPSFYVNSKFYVKEIKGKYYVYSIEKDDGGKQRHQYIAPLDKIIETYVSIGGVGVPPTKVAGQGFEPWSQGPKPWILDH